MKYLILTALLISLNCFSQFRGTDNLTDPRMKLMSPSQGAIFDMSKLSVSHTFAMNYMSSGSNSVMINEYVAGLKYKISDPLTLRLNLGMAYTPYSSFSAGEENSTDIYLKSASLDYKPNNQFRMRVDFRTIKPSDYYMNTDPFRDFDYLQNGE